MTDPPQRRLLTKSQVIAALRLERDRDGLTATAKRYGLGVNQVCDLLSEPARTKLSERMWTALKYRMYQFFERIEE